MHNPPTGQLFQIRIDCQHQMNQPYKINLAEYWRFANWHGIPVKPGGDGWDAPSVSCVLRKGEGVQ